MAKVFLEAGDDYRVVNNGTTVYGVAGDDTDSVVIESGAAGVTVNANVDRVDFAGSIADFTFVAGFGANMMVYAADGTTLLATIPLQEDADGTQLVFADGAISSVYADGAITTGGVALTDTPAAITPDAADIDAGTTTEADVTPVVTAASLSVSDVTVAEDGATATFTVNLSTAPGTGETVTVEYATADGTATAGSDYTAASGTLSFAAGETSKTITVDITDDFALEESETFTVNLSNVAGTIGGTAATISDAEATGTITNDDVAVASYTLTDSINQVVEGNSVTYTLTALDADGNAVKALADTTFTYSLTGDDLGGAAGEAEASDVTPASGTITLAAGQSTVTFTVDAIDEGATEGLEGMKFSILDADFNSVATQVTAIEDAASTAGGKTYTLTTGVDSGAAFTGTSGDDIFIADDTGTDTASTADTLDGAGGADTFNLFTDGTASAIPGMTSIETVNIYDLNAAMDFSSTSDITSLTVIRGEGDDTITVGAGVAVGATSVVVGTGTDNAALTFAMNATDTSATLNLDAVTAKGTDADEDVVLTGAALTSLTVNATGTKSAFDALDIAGVKTVNLNAAVDFTAPIETTGTAGTLTVTGAGKVDLGALDVGFTTVTAADATGGLTAQIGTNDDTVLTGSKGDDVITASTTDALAAGDKLAVNAGDGSADVLVVAATADVDTAEDAARYTNFETIRTADSMNMGLVGGITALQITGGTSETYSGMTATQASNVTFLGDNATSTVFTLANSSGSSDAMTFNLASATATTNVDVIGASVVGVETVNINATTGTDTTGDTAFGFLANKADNVSKVNIAGTADTTLNVVADTLDVVAVNIDASALTGTADFTLALNGGLVAGSSVTGTANNDTLAISSITGTTYDAGAGDDKFTGSIADLVATGTNDTSINGGADADTITLDDTTGVTLIDNHFTNVSGVETLALTATGADDVAVTTGAAFNTAFANGVTITTGTMADGQDINFAAGLATVDINLSVDGSLLVGNGAGEDYELTTGSGNDTVTFAGDATWVGTAAGDGGSIIISTGAGNDTISMTHGTLLAQTTSQAVTITGGTGADNITKGALCINSTGVAAVTKFVIAEGDSLTTAYDTITNFDLVENTGSLLGDVLDFATASVSASTASTDVGAIHSHSITNGLITFDDADAFATALTINSSNISDVLGYLAANVTTAGETVAFVYDSDDSGAADSTMVFNAGTTTDSLVQLVGTQAAGVTATATATDDNYIVIG